MKAARDFSECSQWSILQWLSQLPELNPTELHLNCTVLENRAKTMTDHCVSIFSSLPENTDRRQIWTMETTVSSDVQTCCCSKVRISSTSPSSRFSWEWISHSGHSSGYFSTYVNFSVASTASRRNQIILLQLFQLTSFQSFQTFSHFNTDKCHCEQRDLITLY